MELDSRAVLHTAYASDGSRLLLFEHPLDGSEPKILLETEAKQAEIFPNGYPTDGSGSIFARYEGDATEVRVVLNGFEELRRIASAGD